MTLPHKILIMDDDPAILKMMQQLVVRLGYEVKIASSGQEAVNLYRKNYEEGCSFELVILDLVINHGINGIETMKILKEINPDVRAVLSSGSIYDQAFINYKKYGFIDVLPKPYGLPDVKRILGHSEN